MTRGGRLFQTLAPATAKALSSIVVSRHRGTICDVEDGQRSRDRDDSADDVTWQIAWDRSLQTSVRSDDKLVIYYLCGSEPNGAL